MVAPEKGKNLGNSDNSFCSTLDAAEDIRATSVSGAEINNHFYDPTTIDRYIDKIMYIAPMIQKSH